MLRLSREPVMKLSSDSTRVPRASRASHRCEPMNPAPPETTARSLWLVAAYASVGEAESAHVLRVIDVAPVDDHRTAHRRLDPAEVELAELVPFGDHNQRVRAIGESIRITAVLDVGQLDPRAFHGRRVVTANLGARREQNPPDVQARRFTEVVGIGLEPEAEQPDDAIVELLEAGAHLGDDETPLVGGEV